MNISTQKVLAKVEFYKKALETAQGDEDALEALHHDIVKFCRIVCSTKSVYRAIDIPYPEKVILIITDVADNEKQRINASPEVHDQRLKLSEEMGSTLEEIKRIYMLRQELEEERNGTTVKQLTAISKDVSLIKKHLKIKN